MDFCESPKVRARGSENVVFIKHFFIVKASWFPEMNRHSLGKQLHSLTSGRPAALCPHPQEQPLRPQSALETPLPAIKIARVLITQGMEASVELPLSVVSLRICLGRTRPGGHTWAGTQHRDVL